MPPVATAIGGAASTTSLNALTFTITLTAGAAVGNAVLVSSAERHLGSAPLNPSATDSKGNTYTRLDFGGVGTAQLAMWLSNITTPLVTGDTITVTYLTNNCDEIVITADTTVGYSLTSTVSGGVVQKTSSTTHQYDLQPQNATDFTYGADLASGANVANYSSISGSTFVQIKGTPVQRTIVTYYNNPGTTAITSTIVTWATAHTGSMNDRDFTWRIVAPLSVSGSGTLTAVSSAPAYSVGVSLTGSGTVSTGATGGLSLSGSVGLSGSGTDTPTAVPSPTASVALSGSGTATQAIVANPMQAVTLPAGDGILTGAQTAMFARTSQHPTGDGTLTASGVVTYLGSASLTGSGTVTAAETGMSISLGAATLGASGSLAGAATAMSMTSAAAFNGFGVLTGAGLPRHTGAAPLSGLGLLTLRPKITQRPNSGRTTRPNSGITHRL